MICPVRDELYRYPWPGMTDEERVSLRRHTSECDDCRATVVRLGNVTELLAGGGGDLAPARRVALWSAIETETTAPRIVALTWLRPALGFALVAAVIGLLVLRLAPASDHFRVSKGTITAAGSAVESNVPTGALRATTDAALVLGSDVRIDVAVGSELEIPLTDFVRLDTGRLAVAVEHAEAFIVQTTVARVQLIGNAQVDIQVDAAPPESDAPPHVRVDVARGHATITTAGGQRVEIIGPGAWTNRDAPPRPNEARSSPRTDRPARDRDAPDAEIRARHRADLDRARALVYDDAPAARRIAQAVLDTSADGAEEVDALAVIADAHRRRGEHRLAAEFYGRVAAHPSGRGYAEEALLRRAKMLRALGDGVAALASLEEAERRFAGGPLAPERVALTARTLLELGRVEDAAKVLERAEPSHALDSVRREVDREREMKRSKGSGYP